MRLTKERAIERAVDKVNIIGSCCDVYSVIYSFKVLRELSETEIEEIYNEIIERLGF